MVTKILKLKSSKAVTAILLPKESPFQWHILLMKMVKKCIRFKKEENLKKITLFLFSLGFRASGNHLPTPPPIPPEIQKSLELIARTQPVQSSFQSQYNLQGNYGQSQYNSNPQQHLQQPSGFNKYGWCRMKAEIFKYCQQFFLGILRLFLLIISYFIIVCKEYTTLSV